MANKEGLTPLHIAAFYSNLPAIQIIYEHLDNTRQEIDPNILTKRGITPLACTGSVQKQLKIGEDLRRLTTGSLELRTAKVYEYLRNRGAYLPSEKEGISVW